MSVRGVLVNNDSVDSLVEYQELAAQSAAKAPKSPLTYGSRVDYFDRSHKGKTQTELKRRNLTLRISVLVDLVSSASHLYWQTSDSASPLIITNVIASTA